MTRAYSELPHLPGPKMAPDDQYQGARAVHTYDPTPPHDPQTTILLGGVVLILIVAVVVLLGVKIWRRTRDVYTKKYKDRARRKRVGRAGRSGAWHAHLSIYRRPRGGDDKELT